MDWFAAYKPMPVDDLAEPPPDELALAGEVPAVHEDAEVLRAQLERYCARYVRARGG